MNLLRVLLFSLTTGASVMTLAKATKAKDDGTRLIFAPQSAAAKKIESAESESAKRSGVDYSRFAGLYSREKTLQDTLLRLQKMEELRGSAQTSLESLMSRTKTIELELRYGELIVQRGRDLEQFSMEVLVAGDNKKGQELKEQSHKYLRLGLNIHNRLLTQMKNHPLTPKVYLGIARTEYGLGRKQAAFDAADHGIKWLQGRTVNAGDATLQLYMVRGDAAFDLARGNLALDSYEQALKLVDRASVEEAYLRYKLSWVHYNLKDADRAVAQLDELFKITKDRYALRAEAVQDYALFVADLSGDSYAKAGAEKGVYEYLLQRSDEAAASQALERMARTFAAHGRRADAVKTEEFLIKELGYDVNNYQRALAIVDWTHTLADKKALIDRYYWIMETFGPDSTWFKAQAAKPQIQRNSQTEIESVVRKFAITLHEESSKETVEDLRTKREEVIAKLYDTHLRNYSREKDVPQATIGRVHYYRAEIHRHNKEWALAGERYDSYLRILDVVPKEQFEKIDLKLKDEALWGSVEVWAQAIEKDKKWVGRMITAADRFVNELGTDKRAPQVLLDAALVEEKSGQRPVALNRLEKLVKNYPKTTQAQEAVEASLDILNKESDWINLAQRARTYMDLLDTWVLPKDKDTYRKRLNVILSQTEAKACDALKQDSARKLEAAMCFERYARGFEKDEQAPKALLIAADLYDGLKDPVAAVGALELLVNKYPKSEHAAGGFTRLATVYEKAFEFEKAAAVYETLISSNANLKDRDKLTYRMLELYYALEDTKKFDLWINKKDTASETRKDFQARDRAQTLISLRLEESALGYTKTGLGSVKGQKIFEDLKRRSATLANEELLEFHRIQGNLYRAQNNLDKADKEWMLGLKAFWKITDKSPQVWELGARLRLEQASFYEIQFKNVDVMKNPERKAELFKKLEGWYAEIVQMKAPVTALSALWKAAEVNKSFADQIRASAVPAELMVAGQEANRKTYERLIIERTEPLKQKALSMIKTVAQRAKEWKVLSPDVLSSLKIVAALREQEKVPALSASPSPASVPVAPAANVVVKTDEQQMLRFPWTDLPRWLDLSTEQLAWSEWTQSDDNLTKLFNNPQTKRSEARRAAFVTLVRSGTLANPEVAKWAKTFQDKAGIQARIQAYLNDRNEQRANLFLGQYESFFGEDTFSEFSWGRLEWERGNYSVAYLKWVRPQAPQSNKDFRVAYWTEGWDYMLDEMIDGTPSDSRRKKVYSNLAKLAVEPWQKLYVAKLCIEQKAQCSKEYDNKALAEILNASTGVILDHRFNDGRSAWLARQGAAVSFVALNTPKAKKYEDLEPLRRGLTALYDLQKLSSDSRDVLKKYVELKQLVDHKQEELDAESRKKVLAEGNSR